MLEIFITEEKERWDKRDVILQQGSENTMQGTCGQWRSFKENEKIKKKGTYT